MTRREFGTLIATILGSGIVFLDGSVVNLALPALARDLGAVFSDLQWIVDGYLLSLSALILVAGSFGDVFGRKRVYLIGLVGFGCASLLCGLAPSIGWLIVLRILQGIAAALLVPGGLALINTTIAPERRSVAIGRWAAWSGIAAVIGPLVGGYLIDFFSWRGIFFINVPIVVACFALALVFVRETKDERARRIDWQGSTLAAACLTALTYGLIEGPVRGWQSASLLSMLAGVVLFALFLYTERRAPDPLLDLSLFANRNFAGVNIATFAMYGSLTGFLFALVIYLQTSVRYGGFEAGLAVMPSTLLLLLFSGRMGALTERYGARVFMTAGPLVAAIGIFLLSFVSPASSYLMGVLPGVLLFGVGLTLTVTPLTVTVMRSVAMSSSGIASATNNAVSRVAGLVVLALLGLFGSEHVYLFTSYLCAALAAAAGVASYLMIRSPER